MPLGINMKVKGKEEFKWFHYSTVLLPLSFLWNIGFFSEIKITFSFCIDSDVYNEWKNKLYSFHDPWKEIQLESFSLKKKKGKN